MGHSSRRAFAVLEYVMLMIIILASLFSFRVFMQRALNGQYRKVGDSMAFSRQYAINRTIDCAYDDKMGIWYAQACFSNKVLQNHCATNASYGACINTVMNSCQNGCS